MHHFYGFVSSSKVWRVWVFESAPFDPCLFVLRDENQRAEGLIGVHVDGGLCCGSPRFHAKLAQLEAKYLFGSKRSREFVFTG